MSGEGRGPSRWVFWATGASALLVLGLFALALLRDPSEIRSVSPARPGENPGDKVRESRQELVRSLLGALEEAAGKSDRKRISELSEELVREKEASVAMTLEALKKSRVWNFRIALLNVLSSIPTQASVQALEELYASLQPVEKALKIETVRRLARMGGTFPREALERILIRETDESVRGEAAKALVALGLTPRETTRLPKPERELLETQVKLKEEQRGKIAALEKLDARSEASLPELKRSALDEQTIAIAALAFEKLEERGDGKAAEILATRVKAKAETNEQKILQTNALASLARMKAAEARLAVKEFALGEDESLRVQSVDLVGGYGDRAMIPLLEQAVLKDKSTRMARAVERARTAIESRVPAREPGQN